MTYETLEKLRRSCEKDGGTRKPYAIFPRSVSRQLNDWLARRWHSATEGRSTERISHEHRRHHDEERIHL
jgi:hypothetical protein